MERHEAKEVQRTILNHLLEADTAIRTVTTAHKRAQKLRASLLSQGWYVSADGTVITAVEDMHKAPVMGLHKQYQGRR